MLTQFLKNQAARDRRDTRAEEGEESGSEDSESTSSSSNSKDEGSHETKGSSEQGEHRNDGNESDSEERARSVPNKSKTRLSTKRGSKYKKGESAKETNIQQEENHSRQSTARNQKSRVHVGSPYPMTSSAINRLYMPNSCGKMITMNREAHQQRKGTKDVWVVITELWKLVIGYLRLLARE
jgi:hypothetical protein